MPRRRRAAPGAPTALKAPMPAITEAPIEAEVAPNLDQPIPEAEPLPPPLPEPTPEPEPLPEPTPEPELDPTPEPTPEPVDATDEWVKAELERRAAHTPNTAMTAAEAVAIVQNALDAANAKATGEVLFVTADDFGSKRFDIHLGPGERVRGTYDATRTRVQFRVPHELADRFRRHEFVRLQRLVEVKA